MGRYIYKPLLAKFESEPGDIDYEEKKYDFIQKYKHSLIAGELIVDLSNYDIYVSNNGLEYPVPSTPDIKREIIEWIESDEGPLSSLGKNNLINTKTDDITDSNIIRKQEKLESLMNEVKFYEKVVTDKINEDENTVLKLEKEVNEWYNNLSEYTLAKVYNASNDKSDIAKTVYSIICKFIDLYGRLDSINNYYSSMIETKPTIKNDGNSENDYKYFSQLSKYILNYNDLDNFTFRKYLDKLNISTSSSPRLSLPLVKYAIDIKNCFHQLIENDILLQYKLNKNEIEDSIPLYNFEMKFKTGVDNTNLINTLQNVKRIDYKNNAFIKINKGSTDDEVVILISSKPILT